MKNNITSTDLSLALGLGMNIMEKFGVNFRYTFGFNTVDNTTNPDDLKNNIFAFTLNYDL